MVIVITGPTAVGKTKLSIELAKQLNGEIINCDSTQIFKTLDIATAKIKEQEKENIPHHLIDIKEITEDYTVFDYQKDAREKINQILKKNKTPILVGGTGLYIKACLYDYKFEEETKLDFSHVSKEEIFEELNKLDPNHNIHINNKKRLERALSYIKSTNKLFSEQEKTQKILYNTIFIGLTCERELLYEKINNRVDEMIKEGLLEESENIFKSNIRTKAITTPIGYKELFPYFEKKQTLENCLDTIKQNSRRYAKRQYTWLNNQMNINWFTTDYENFENTINQVKNYIKKETK